MKNLNLKLTINADGNINGVVRGINNDLNKFKGKTKAATEHTDQLGNSLKRAGGYAAAAFGGFQLVQGVRNIVASADAYSSLEGQLKLVTDSASEFLYVQNELNRISFETRGDIGSMTKLYSALAPTFREMGKSTEESTRLVSLYNKSLALTSPTATEASSATLQFAQAMGSGVLRGEEFNSIMENGRGVAMMLADGLDVPIGSLRAMAEQGELTADIVVAALERQEATINEKFTNIPLTVSGAWQNMRTQAMLYIGEQDKAIGASTAFAESLNVVAANIDTVASVTGGALVLATTAAAGKITNLTVAKVSDMKATAVANAKDLERLASLKSVALAEHQASIAVLEKARAQKVATAGTALAVSTEKAYAAALRTTRTSVRNLKESTIAYNAVAGKGSAIVTGLRGAMSMLGGPVGIGLAIASFASYSFASDEAAVNTQEMIDRVSTLTGKFDELGKSQTQQALKQINADIEMMRAKVFTSQDKSLWDTWFGDPDAARKQATEEFKAYQALIKGRKELEAQLAGSSTSTKNIRKENLIESEADEKAWNDAVKKFYKEYQDELDAAAKAQEKLNKINKSYAGDIEQLRFEMVKYKLTNADVAAAEAMRAAYAKGYSRDQINAIGNQTKALFALEQANKVALKEEKAVADERNIIYENLFKRLDDGFAQMWYDVADGSKTAFDFIQESFKRMLAEMAHAAITKPIIINAMGMDDKSAGLNLLSQGMGYGSAMMAGAGSQQASMLAAQTAEFGTAGSAMTAGAFGTTSGSIAAGMSAALPWVAGGLAVEALTGGAISKALTGGDWKRKNAEISLNGGLDYVSATQAVTSKKSGGVFSSSKTKTNTADISGSLGATVSGLLREIDSIANQIGYDLANDFATNVTVSAGKKGDIQAAMAEAVGTVTNEAINSIGGLRQKLEAMQYQGESLTDTLKRLAAETEAEQQAAAKAADEKARIAEQNARIAQQEREARLQLVTDSEKALVAQYKVFESQSSSLKSTLLELADPQQALAYQREQELKAIDPLLRDQQKRLWALQDEAAAINQAQTAHSAYQSTLEGVLGRLGGAFKTIRQFTAALVLGASATGASYASDLALAQTGDQAALSSITQSAQSYLDDFKSKSATALDYERVKAGVITDLNALPEQISASQMIAEEFKTAIKDQTDTLSFDYASNLKENFDALIPIVGKTITKDEFASVYAGTASDSELTKIFESIAGSNGLIDATDLTTAAAADTALKTDSVSEKAKSQLTELESIAESTKGQIAAMGVLTEALGYASNVQQQAVLSAAVETAQQRLDSVGITADQVADYEAKKATAAATDAGVLQGDYDKKMAKYNESYSLYKGWYDQGFITKDTLTGMANDTYANTGAQAAFNALDVAKAADRAFASVSNLSNDVQRYYDVAAQLKAAQDALASFDGSHADGLAYVPFDGYVGQLHEGEAVLDANTMSGLRKYGINVNTPKNDNSELIAEIRQLRLEVTMLLANQNNISMGIASSNVSLTRYAKRASVVGYKVNIVG